jgi:hypothetical protein
MSSTDFTWETKDGSAWRNVGLIHGRLNLPYAHALGVVSELSWELLLEHFSATRC